MVKEESYIYIYLKHIRKASGNYLTVFKLFLCLKSSARLFSSANYATVQISVFSALTFTLGFE